MDETVVQIDNLKVSFFTKIGEVKAVDGISYSINKGKTLGIVGESGCGKSVSSYSIMGLLAHPGKIVDGTITFKGEKLNGLGEEEYTGYRGKKMAMIFQEPMTALNPVLTIGQQISEQVLRHAKRDNKKDAIDLAIEMLDLVGIPSPHKRVYQYPHELSGGMKQRAMIAMALSCDPQFLIADEPTTALDVTIQAQILELIQKLQEKFHMTVQFITHDLGVISEIADDVIVMYAGQVVEVAKAEDLFDHPRHPYTHGLLSSIPRLGKKVDRLSTISGNVPSPLNLPPGCPFQNRCPFVTDECKTHKPILEDMGGGHKVACIHPVS